MNDLRGILVFLMLGLSFVASVNFECRKHFKCVNTTYFYVCVDFGDGKLSTIEGLAYPCPPPFICEETNIHECQLPLVTTTISPSSTPTSLPYKSSTILNISEASSVTRPLSTQASDNLDEAPLIVTILPKHGVTKEDSKIIEDNNMTKDNVTSTYLITETTQPMKTNFTTTTSLDNSTISNVTSSVKKIVENEFILQIKGLEVDTSAKKASNSFDNILANYTVTSSTNMTISEKQIPARDLNITNNLTNADVLLLNGPNVFIKMSNETINNKILPSHLEMNINISSNKDVIKSINNITTATIEGLDIISNNNSEKKANSSNYDIYSHITELTTPNYTEPTQPSDIYSARHINTSFLVNLPLISTDQTANRTPTIEEYVSKNITKIETNEKNKKDNVIDFIHNDTSTTFFSETEKPPLLILDTTTESIEIVPSNTGTQIILKNNFTHTEYLYSDKKNVSTEHVEEFRNSTVQMLLAKENKTNETTSTKTNNIYEFTTETVIITNNLSTEQTTDIMPIQEDNNTTTYIDSAKITHNNITKSFTENNTNKASNNRVKLGIQLINRTDNLTEIKFNHFPNYEMNKNISHLMDITMTQSPSAKDVPYTTTAYKEDITIKDDQQLQTEATVTYIPLVITETISKEPNTIHNVSEEKNNNSNNYLMTINNSDSVLMISTEVPTTQSNFSILDINVFTRKDGKMNIIFKLKNTTEMATINGDLPSTEHIEVSNIVTEINKTNVREIKIGTTFETTTEIITTIKFFTDQVMTANSPIDNIAIKGSSDVTKINLTETMTINMSNEYNKTRNRFNDSVGALYKTHFTKDNNSQVANSQSKPEFKMTTKLNGGNTPVEQIPLINKTSQAIKKLNVSVDYQMNEKGDKSIYNLTTSSQITKDYNKYSDIVEKNNASEFTENITIKDIEPLLSTEETVAYIPTEITEIITVTPSTTYYNAVRDNNNESNNYLTKTNSVVTTMASYTEVPTTLSIFTHNENNMNAIFKSKYTTETISINKDFLSTTEDIKVSNDDLKNVIWTPRNNSNIGELKTSTTFDNTTETIPTTVESSTEITTVAYSSTVSVNIIAIKETPIILNSDIKETVTIKMSNKYNESRNGFNEIVSNTSEAASTQPKTEFKTTTERNPDKTFIEQIIPINNTSQAPRKLNVSVDYQINDNGAKPIYNSTKFSSVNKDHNKYSDVVQNKDNSPFTYTENINEATITHNLSVITEIMPGASTTLYNISKESMNKVNSSFMTARNTEIEIMKPFLYIETITMLNVNVTANNNNNTVFKSMHSLPSKLENTTDTTSVNEDFLSLMVSNVSKDIHWTPINDANIGEIKTNTTTEIITTTANSHIKSKITNNATKSDTTASIVMISIKQKNTENDFNEIIDVTPHMKYNLSDTVTNDLNETFENSTENVITSTPVDQITTINNTLQHLTQRKLQLSVGETNNNVLLIPTHTATTHSSGVKDDEWIQIENNTVFANDTIKNNQQLTSTTNISTKIRMPMINIDGTLEYNASSTMPAPTENDYAIMNISTIIDNVSDIRIVNEELSSSTKDVKISKNATKTGKWSPMNSLNVEEVKTFDMFNTTTKIIPNTTNTNAVSPTIINSLVKNLNNSMLEEISYIPSNMTKSLTERTVKNSNYTVISEAVDNTKNYIKKSFTEKTFKISNEYTKGRNYTDNIKDIPNQPENIFKTTTENVIVIVNAPVKQNTSTSNTVEADELLTMAERKSTFSIDYRTNSSITKMIYDPLNISDGVKEYNKLAGVKNASDVYTEIFALGAEKSTTESFPSPKLTTAHKDITEVKDHNLDATTEYSIAYVDPTIEKPMATIIKETARNIAVKNTSKPTYSSKIAIHNENNNNINKSPANTTNANDKLADEYQIKNGVDMVHDFTMNSNNRNGTSSETKKKINTKYNNFVNDKQNITADKSLNVNNISQNENKVQKNTARIKTTTRFSIFEITEKLANPNKVANVSKVSLDMQQSSSIKEDEEKSSKIQKTSNVMMLKESIDTASINKKLYHSQQKNISEEIETHFHLHNTTMITLHTAENITKVQTTTNKIKINLQQMKNSTEINHNITFSILTNTPSTANMPSFLYNGTTEKINNKDINDNSVSKLVKPTDIIVQEKISNSELSPNIVILEKTTTNNRNIDAQQQTIDVEIFETSTLNRNYTKAEFTTENNFTTESNKIPIFQQKYDGNETLKRYPLNISNSLKYDCRQRSPGKHADNDDCRTFYICIPNRTPIVKKCSENTVFSEIRKQCTKELSHCIRNKEFQCPREGRFSDITKDIYYYICVMDKQRKFIKFKFQCQEGFHLNKSSVKCVMDVMTSTIPLDTKHSEIESSSEINTTPKVSSSTEKESIEDIKCKKEGKFADPYDCRKYYECSEKNDRLRKKIKKCGSDEVFDIDKKSMNIVTSRSTSETLTETNNKMIIGEGTEEAITSTQNIHSQERPGTFNCHKKNRGNYADQVDCKIYYVCIGKHSPLVRNCPDDTVFSEIENNCTKKLSHCIRQNEFRCTREGKFIDILKDNHFYICARHNVNHYIRFHLKCEDNFYLDKISMKCMRQKENSDSVSAQISGEQRLSRSIEFDCQEEGTFSDPHNCRKYYVCSKKDGRFRKKKKNCKGDEVFDIDKKKCVSAESYKCNSS